MKKRKERNIFCISFTLLLISIKTVAASSYQDISEIPVFIQIFILLMGVQIALSVTLVKEVMKLTHSRVWNFVLVANFFSLLIVVTQSILIYKLYFSPNKSGLLQLILPLSTSFIAIAHVCVNISLYLLIKPIIQKRLNLLKINYLILYVLFPIVTYTLTILILDLKFPILSKFIILYLFLVLSLLLTLYFAYYNLFLSKSYARIGFITKPAFIAGIGAISFVSSIFLLVYFTLKYAGSIAPCLFFNMFFYLVACAFGMSYYLCFAVEYPSLLNPKWKTYMPFDLVKVTAAVTVAFLALSLFFTVMEHGTVYYTSLLENIPYPFFFLVLLHFSAIILILTYTKALASKTRLKYWNYIRYGLYIHLIATFYVLCLAFLLWVSSNTVEKLVFSAIFALAFVFYLFYALDLRKICKGREIKPVFNKIDIARYITSLYSLFFLILFSISFTCKSDIQIFGAVNLESYPFFIFFILSFLIAFVAYLNVSHKGFEEVMQKNIWSGLSYISSFAIFIFVYIIFSFKEDMQYFPLRDLFFIGYFAVLIIEIAAIKSLIREKEVVKGEIEAEKKRKEDIVDTLNSYANKFFRVDQLEDLWLKMVDRYVPEDKLTKIGFDTSERRFYLEMTDESTRLKIAVGILLGMHKFPDIEQIANLNKSVEETKEEIAEVLKEKVLMLPEDLRSQFDEDVYYPVLLEKEVNKLIIGVEAFIPFSEQKMIFDRLKGRAEKFKCICFENEKIQIEEGTRFSRREFLELFRFYLESLEAIFPFRRFLLYELIREEIKEGLVPYGITISELLDVVPTGIEKLDEIIAGGLAKWSSTLLIAEETKAKDKILLSFIKEGLREGTNVIYATAKRPARQIQGELLTDIDELKNFMMLDLYEDIYREARVYKVVEEEHRIIVPLNKIMFQRSIVKTIKSHPRDLPKIVVIDVYDNFSRYYSPEEVQKILQDQIDGLKRWNCTSLITINPHSYLMRKVGVELVKKDFDNVMILSGEDKDAAVFIDRLYHGTPSRQIIRLY
jgi:KaiC/GvpD/RAD55 family RecA-like ATPase